MIVIYTNLLVMYDIDYIETLFAAGRWRTSDQ